MQTIDAILMASGFSRRFPDGDKLLAPFRGAPLAEHMLRLAVNPGIFAEVYFVCASPGVARLAEGMPVHVVMNGRPGRGQRESIRLGVYASASDFLMFCPCDQPLLDADTLVSIANAARPGRIAVPTVGGRTGAPVLFSRAFAQELAALDAGQTGKAVIQRHPEAVDRVAIQNRRAFFDVDSPDDLKALALME